MELLEILKHRNSPLFWFGLINFILAAFFIAASILKPIEFNGVNAWYKPIKFALSIGILVWTIGWYSAYVEAGKALNVINWILIISLAMEIIYIGWQANRGLASHFNVSTPFHSFMYSLMAIGATMATLAVAAFGILLYTNPSIELPDYYRLALYLGIACFVIFAFEGFAMGARLSHTVGSSDGGKGIFFLNWSRLFGDLRVAHFIGMHALQIIPIIAWYFLKDVRLVIALGLLYFVIAGYVLVQALQTKPFLPHMSAL